MINLMPDGEKQEIRAARTNVILARYIIVILCAFGFLILLLAGSYVVLTQTKEAAQRLVSSNSTKATADYSATKAQVDALSASLSQTKTILDQEVLYSNVLMNIGQQMPAGTVLQGVTLNAASFTGTPVIVKAYAKTTDDAVTLRQKFQSTPIFTNVNFDSVSDSGGIDDYPVSVSITLTITRAAAQ